MEMGNIPSGSFKKMDNAPRGSFKKYADKDREIQENVSRQESNARSRAAVEKENAEKALNGFRARETVNGIEISVAWTPTLPQGYTIYFPQAPLYDPENPSKKHVSEQIIRIDKDEKIAKQVFEEACHIATFEPDVYKVYNRVQGVIESINGRVAK